MPTPSPSRSDLALQRRIARERFLNARIAEREYARHLVRVGKHVGAIVLGFVDKGKVSESDFEKMERSLSACSKLLTPWAFAVTERMQKITSLRDLRAWKQLSNSIGSGLHVEIAKTPVGLLQRQMLAESVRLITSLPTEAAERVHRLTLEAIISGERAAEVAREIMRTGDVTAARARLIARTEVARTASTLTQARAEYVGSAGYIWRGVDDVDERKEHRVHNGKVFSWDAPPISGPKGERYHAGQGPNCRCWPEP